MVGASADPTKRGHQILRSLLRDGFEGAVYAVNPRGGEILGHRVYDRIEALPDVPDLAVVCTPAASAPEVVEACGRRGIPGAVILAVGFGETGTDGAALEARLRQAGDRTGVRVVGPNTSGLLNLPLGLNLVGVPGVAPGVLSLLVQSGNVALHLMREATRDDGPGIAVCAGLGNEVDVGFGECLGWLGDHPPTRAIICYTEGIRDPRAFLQAAARVTRRKPVVLLAAGRSPQGARAARSHTGAVAAPFDRLRAGLLQAGVVPVTRTDELIPVAEALASQPPAPPGSGVAVLSDGGGHGTLVADHLSEMGVPLAPLSAGTRAALATLLGPASSQANPVDLAGAADADPRVFGSALDILVRDEAVGVVLMVGLFGGYAARFDESLLESEVEAAEALARVARRSGKGLLVHSLFAADGTEPLTVLRREGVPVVTSLEVACRCSAELWRRGRLLAAPPWQPAGPTGSGGATHTRDTATSPPSPGVEAVLGISRAGNRDTLTEVEARGLLEDRGIPLPPARLCRTAEEAVAAAADFAGPVALKVVSPEIPHKTEADGVALGIEGPDAVREAFHAVQEGARRYLGAERAEGAVAGILVMPMQPTPLAELLVGVSREGGMGPVLTLGSGGIWVDWIRDVGHRVLPVDRRQLRGLLEELNIGPILAGARGRPPGHIDGVLRVAEGLGRLALEVPEIEEIEVNPLFVYSDRVVPVDVRVFLAPRTRGVATQGVDPGEGGPGDASS